MEVFLLSRVHIVHQNQAIFILQMNLETAEFDLKDADLSVPLLYNQLHSICVDTMINVMLALARDIAQCVNRVTKICSNRPS
jgi:hypothetical protein